jgi:hypothetical protein
MKPVPYLLLLVALLLSPCLHAQSPLDSALAKDPRDQVDQFEKQFESIANPKDREALYKQLAKQGDDTPMKATEREQYNDNLKTAYQNVTNKSSPPDLPKIQLRQTSQGDGFKKSATFSFERLSGRDIYSVKASLIIGTYQKDLPGSILDLWIGNDFDLSSDTSKNPGTISNHLVGWLHPIRSGTELSNQDGWKGLDYYFDISHQANRNYKTKDVVGQVLVQPALKFGDIAIGWQEDLGSLGRYEFDPLFGVEAGTVISHSATSPEHGGIERGIVKLHFSFVPTFAQGKFTLYADDSFRFLGDDHYNLYNLFSAGAEYKITDNVSLTIADQIGRDSPSFKESSDFTLGIGLKY